MGGLSFTRPCRLIDEMNVEAFSCGREPIDTWFLTRSKKALERHTAVVYVSFEAGADKTIASPAGFYSLSNHAIARDSVEGGWLQRNTPEYIPVILLGMLGVDLRFQGQGLGRLLLGDALKKASIVASISGTKALVVQPLDETAAGFYQHYGFKYASGAGWYYVPLK